MSDGWTILCAGSTRPGFFFRLMAASRDGQRCVHDFSAIKRALDFEIEALSFGRDDAPEMVAADIGVPDDDGKSERPPASAEAPLGRSEQPPPEGAE